MMNIDCEVVFLLVEYIGRISLGFAVLPQLSAGLHEVFYMTSVVFTLVSLCLEALISAPDFVFFSCILSLYKHLTHQQVNFVYFLDLSSVTLAFLPLYHYAS